MKFFNLFRVSFSSKFVESSVVSLVSLTIAAVIISFPSVVRAETHIPATTLEQDTFWDKSGSPYVLDESVTVPYGVTLTIGPGVEVIGDPTYTNPIYIYVDGGSLVVKGKGLGADRVYIRGFDGIYFNNAVFDIANADLEYQILSAEDSRGVMATSTVTNALDGLIIDKSEVSVQGSKISGSKRAVTVHSVMPPVLMMNGVTAETGGIGNAFDDHDAPRSPSLTVVNSLIVNSVDYAIENYSTSTVTAKNNWWGRPEGPLPSDVKGDSIEGLVDYEPWLTSEPALDPGPEKPEVPDCCSSILFLPGLEASSLYRPEEMPLGINTTNTLWPPNRNDDVRKLFLNTDGSNPDPTIYSGKPIGKVFGLYGVYDKFMDFLDGMTSDGTVNEWKSFGYDWRAPIAEVVAGPEQKATTTEYLVQTVEDLASRSKTGKVTLIAHSNGGLVAKYLVKTLVDLGKESLIDSVVSVAVPYLGTPQAIAGLLHGDNQAIAGGFITTGGVARRLGQNMASAYSLLPSAEYFSKVLGPTIAFASSTVDGLNDGSYPMNIQSADDQSSFISDTSNIRETPSVNNLKSPIKGNQFLMAAAEALHAIIDPFTWPATISRWAIAGWNLDTARKLQYSDNGTPSKIGTNMGDGTVVAKSAVYEAGQIMSVDLDKSSQSENKTIEHANILESSDTQQMVGNAVTKKEYEAVCAEVEKLPGVTCGEPDYSKEIIYKPVILRTHSPVELHLYDEQGRHTGEIPIPPELIAEYDIEEGLYVRYEEEIPGTQFNATGGGIDNETTVYIYPEDIAGEKLTIVLKGTGVGAFTLDIDRMDPDSPKFIVEHVEYADLPVTSFTVASTTFQVPKLDPYVAANSIASSSQPIVVDIDGDGTVDMTATSSTNVTSGDPHNPIRYLEALKKIVTTVLGSANPSKNLIKRIDRLEKLVSEGKEKRVIKVADRFEKRVSRIKPKKLSSAEKKQIIDMIEGFLVQFGQ